MTKDEAMKLALEVLGDYIYDPLQKEQVVEAIAAIKEALAQRPWVGLTDAEIYAVAKAEAQKMSKSTVDLDYARAIEAKLKEKNT